MSRDDHYFRELAEGHTNDSPESEYPDWRADCPKCLFCSKPIDEDRGCLDSDCIAEREDNDADN